MHVESRKLLMWKSNLKISLDYTLYISFLIDFDFVHFSLTSAHIGFRHALSLTKTQYYIQTHKPPGDNRATNILKYIIHDTDRNGAICTRWNGGATAH